MRYITKGDLLTLLGPDQANAFTAFMINPESFGVSGAALLEFKVAKQKLDWTHGINLDLPEIQQMIQTFVNLGVFSQETIAILNAVGDNPELDTYSVRIIAQDDIVPGNPYGAELIANNYHCRVDFENVTKGITTTQDFIFDVVPTEQQMLDAISGYVKKLKKDSNT